ncbi:hypothetical protein ACFPM0_21740 [Pseudonocardia sulfidoxydans]|uniref:hypothetical protein n=1 Tax=Pseudonocardia sulfidoxydans TaxID=54011 RepID=UPI00360DDB73
MTRVPVAMAAAMFPDNVRELMRIWVRNRLARTLRLRSMRSVSIASSSAAMSPTPA